MNDRFAIAYAAHSWKSWSYVAGDFRSLKDLVRPIWTQHGIYLIKAPSPIQRACGSSNVVYIGQSGGGKRSGTQGIGGRLFNTRGSDKIVLNKIEGLFPGKQFTLECACLDNVDPAITEAELLQAYFDDHCELPPANHSCRIKSE